MYTAKDSWLGATADLGAIGAMYNLTMDPYEKYDMTFNGAATHARAVVIAGKVRGFGQRLGPVAIVRTAGRFRQIDREVSEHQTRTRRGIERLGAKSEGSCKPGALCGS